MRRAVAIAAAALALLGGAGAAAAATARTVVTFSHWDVIVLRHGKKVSHRVAVGATFRRCASQRLYEVDAFYTTKGPSKGGDTELWYLNAKLRDTFKDNPPKSPLGAAGAFSVFDTKSALPSGSWKLIIRYGGKQVGQAAVKVTVNGGC